MPRTLAVLLLFLLALPVFAAVPKPPPTSTDPATPLVLLEGRTLWVRGPEVQEDRIVFWDAAGLSRSFVMESAVDWPATQAKTEAHQKRIAETGEPVRVLTIIGDAEGAYRLAQSSERARKANYRAAMQIPLETEGEKAIVKADELAARMKIAQAKCDAISVAIGPNASAARIMWIQESIRRQCERYFAEARAGGE